jgi:Uma2 family endonuclease
MGMAAPTRWTAAMVRALPDDGKRYEVIDGELLVTPSPVPQHQWVVTVMVETIAPYVHGYRLGLVMTSPSDIELDTHGLVQPDVFVTGPVAGHFELKWNAGAPYLLFVEVLSPGTARYDRIIKRKRFQRAGIPEYWIVDCDARTIERWRPADERPEILSETLVWQPAAAHPPLAIDVTDLFARIHLEQ